MAEWVRAAAASDLPTEGLGYPVKVAGLQIALFKWEEGVFAIEDLCPHLGFPLSEGVMQSGEVICSWHGWRVRLEDGSCRRDRERAKVFPAEVRGDDIFVLI